MQERRQAAPSRLWLHLFLALGTTLARAPARCDVKPDKAAAGMLVPLAAARCRNLPLPSLEACARTKPCHRGLLPNHAPPVRQ